MTRRFISSLLCITNLFATLPVPAQQRKTQQQPAPEQKVYTGKSVAVSDGDTFTLLTADKKQYHIRLDGIDAPEKGMPYYKVAKQYLADLLLNQSVRCEISKTDQYNRFVARVYIMREGKKTYISEMMLQAGLAWHYAQYNKEQHLADLAAQARTAKKGLWAEPKPTPPWVVRKYRRSGISDAEYRKMQQERNPALRLYQTDK